MIVTDASAVLEVLLRTARAEPIEARLFDSDETLHAPHLIDIEITQVLRRYALAAVMDLRRAEEALEDFAELPLVRHPHDVLLPRIWALRDNATAYDAAYLALAEALEAPLLTCDAALASAGWHRAEVELIR